MAGDWTRFWSLDRSRRALVLEAAALMVLVWTGLRLLRFTTLRRLLDRAASSESGCSRDASSESGDSQDASSESGCSQDATLAVSEVGWAAGVVAARLTAATCLVQALAADVMLRRRGVESEVRFGIRSGRHGTVPIEGHAWVEWEGRVAVGSARSVSDFHVLT